MIQHVPLHTRLVPIFSSDEHDRHTLEFGVVGSAKPAKVVIGSALYSEPKIERRLDRGGIDLSDRLIDLLAIGCFHVISGFVIDHDGECGMWTSRDVTRWVRGAFSTEDSNQILKALLRHVTPNLHVADQVVVGDDDVVLAGELASEIAFHRKSASWGNV